MRKSERFTQIVLVIIVLAALVAIILQVLNEETSPLETTYEIITFGVSLTALVIAVLQGLANARTSRELHKIAREIHKDLVEHNKK
jgi:divalent metal cation (Fe/Co/Zn/Cd) transporter